MRANENPVCRRTEREREGGGGCQASLFMSFGFAFWKFERFKEIMFSIFLFKDKQRTFVI